MAQITSSKSRYSSRRPRALSHGRPTTSAQTSSTSSSSTRNIASRHTRRLIRTHHTLQKRLANATRAGDTALASSLQAELDAQGGLEGYQAASVNGADKRRGGDTSRKLLEFLAHAAKDREGDVGGVNSGDAAPPLTMLDVGALSCDTAASRSGLFGAVERIDLRSRERGIKEQDFMQRPLPSNDDDDDEDGARFDVVCLSLVVNYVPDARGRGEMLKRACEFLRVRDHDQTREKRQGGTVGDVFPAVFLVLPAPCVTNSRYLNQELLEAIMGALGFSLAGNKMSPKLAYSLWTWHGRVEGAVRKFSKTEVNPGKSRNNFAIVLD